MKIAVVVLALLAAAGSTQCGGSDDRTDDVPAPGGDAPRTEAQDMERLAAMEAGIDSLIGEASCTESAQCKVTAFGAKPCGGAWKYKVYSAATVSEAVLAERIASYNAFNRELNEKYGWVSDCMVVTPPPVECREGRCGAGEGS